MQTLPENTKHAPDKTIYLFFSAKIKKIKSSIYSGYYADACNEQRGPSLRHGTWATQKRRSGGEPFAKVSDFTGQGIELKTFRADRNVLNHYANWPVAFKVKLKNRQRTPAQADCSLTEKGLVIKAFFEHPHNFYKISRSRRKKIVIRANAF